MMTSAPVFGAMTMSASLRQRRIRIRRDGDGERAEHVRAADRGDGVRRRPRGRNADDRILRLDLGIHRGDRGVFVILGAFDRVEKRALAAGHEHAHERRIDAVRRRQFGGVEHGDPSARSGAGVEEPAAVRHAIGDLIDGVRDAVGLRGNGAGDERVLLLNDPHDLARRSQVDVQTRFEPLLAHGPAKISSEPMPTLMQKIRLAFRGWQRRREESEKEFLTRNASWGARRRSPRPRRRRRARSRSTWKG